MIRVGVIRGGIGDQYDASLKTGADVISCLMNDNLESKYKVLDIFIDKAGVWHLRGIPIELSELVNKVDLVFSALHGKFGEDGKIQQLLDRWKIPYTGSGAFASAMGSNKALSKERFNNLGIKTPAYILFPAYQEDIDAVSGLSGEAACHKYAEKKAHEVIGRISPPWIVKPLSGSFSINIYRCNSFFKLVEAIEKLTRIDDSILVEEFIEGKQATMGVIENFREQKIYTLPPIELGLSQNICPGNFSDEEKRELGKLAELIHTGFNLSHYSRSDFIIHPRRGIYALEVNTLPGMTDESLFTKALKAVGSDSTEFIDHLIKLAKNSHKN